MPITGNKQTKHKSIYGQQNRTKLNKAKVEQNYKQNPNKNHTSLAKFKYGLK
jgi:hypothetical protein